MREWVGKCHSGDCERKGSSRTAGRPWHLSQLGPAPSSFRKKAPDDPCTQRDPRQLAVPCRIFGTPLGAHDFARRFTLEMGEEMATGVDANLGTSGGLPRLLLKSPPVRTKKIALPLL